MLDEAAIAALYERMGPENLRAMVAGFYEQVPTDDILGPMYPPDDLSGAERRLLGFLVFRFGGPQDYIEERGHPRLRMRHAPFAIDMAARDRWVKLMDASIDRLQIDAETVTTLKAFLHHIATFLINRGEPELVTF